MKQPMMSNLHDRLAYQESILSETYGKDDSASMCKNKLALERRYLLLDLIEGTRLMYLDAPETLTPERAFRLVCKQFEIHYLAMLLDAETPLEIATENERMMFYKNLLKEVGLV
jgi:hypothetical protein